MSNEFAGVAAELGDAGPCPVVECRGKTWQVGWPTQRAKAQLEFLVVQQAKANLESLRPVLSAADWKAEQDSLTAAIRGGHWKTWGSLWQNVCDGPDTNNLFLASLLRERHPDATLGDAEVLWVESAEQVKDALAQVVPLFFALLVTRLSATPEQKALMVAQSTAQFLVSLSLPTPSAVGDSSAATTS